MKAQIIPFGVAIKASIFFHIHIASYTNFNTLSLIQSPKNSGHPEEKSLLGCLTLEKSFPLSKAMFLGNAPWKASPLRSSSLLWVVVTSKKTGNSHPCLFSHHAHTGIAYLIQHASMRNLLILFDIRGLSEIYSSPYTCKHTYNMSYIFLKSNCPPTRRSLEEVKWDKMFHNHTLY